MDQNQGNSGSEETRETHERERLIAEISEILQEENDEVLQGMVKFVKAVKEDTGTKRELMNFHKNKILPISFKGFAILLLQTGSKPRPNQQNVSSFSSSSSPTTTAHTPCLSPKKICVQPGPGIIEGNCTNASIETGTQSEAIASSSSSSSHTADTVPARSTSLSVSAKTHMNQLTNTKNPLQNDYILRRIFEFCSVETLKNSRLVSTSWRDASFNLWRKNAVLQVYVRDGNKNQITAADISLNNFQLRTKPFHCYKLDLFVFEHQLKCWTGAPVWQQIFLELSPSIYYLDAYSHQFVEWMPLFFTKLLEVRHFVLRIYLVVMSKAIFALACDPKIQPHLNLKTLELYYCQRFQYDLDCNYAFLTWRSIFRNFPNLEIFRLKYDSVMNENYNINVRNPAPMHQDVIRKLLPALECARAEKDFTTLNLKELSIYCHYDSCLKDLPAEVAEAIVSCKFPLERLIMDFGSTTNDSTFFSLLRAHSETLEYLKAIRAPNTSFLETRVSHLESYWMQPKISLMKLKELHLPDGLSWGFYALSSLDFPNLEKLIIENVNLREGGFMNDFCYDSDSNDDYCNLDLNQDLVQNIDRNFPLETFLQKVHLPKLVKFLYAGAKEFGMSELRALAKSMPNLKDLGVYIDKAVTIDDLTMLWPGLIKYENKKRGKWCKPRQD